MPGSRFGCRRVHNFRQFKARGDLGGRESAPKSHLSAAIASGYGACHSALFLNIVKVGLNNVKAILMKALGRGRGAGGGLWGEACLAEGFLDVR